MAFWLADAVDFERAGLLSFRRFLRRGGSSSESEAYTRAEVLSGCLCGFG